MHPGDAIIGRGTRSYSCSGILTIVVSIDITCQLNGHCTGDDIIFCSCACQPCLGEDNCRTGLFLPAVLTLLLR